MSIDLKFGVNNILTGCTPDRDLKLPRENYKTLRVTWPGALPSTLLVPSSSHDHLSRNVVVSSDVCPRRLYLLFGEL